MGISKLTNRVSLGRMGDSLPVLVLSAFLLPISRVSGQGKLEHPFIESKDIKSETCLTCHPEKKDGKFVHTAVGMGCENCHQAASENKKTTITLVAVGGELCAMCHAAKKDPVLHGPYKNGQCLLCHDPHASEFKAQTRVPINALCQGCHEPRRTTSEMLPLFGSQSISAKDFEAIPKVELDPTQRFGHPWVGHPVAERPDPLRQGEKMSCLSCHDPHASTQAMLMLAGKPGTDICDSCHQAVDEQRAAGTQKPSQPKAQPQAPAGHNKPGGAQP